MNNPNRAIGSLYALAGFLLLQTLFGQFTLLPRQIPGWRVETSLLFLDRLLYFLFLPVGGALLYFRLPPLLGIGRRPFEPPRRPGPWLSGIAGGVGGLLLFAALLGWLQLTGSDNPRTTTEGFSGAPTADSIRFGIYLFSTGIGTPILEELFYRAVFLRFLLELEQPPPTAILLQALCFGLSHPLTVAPVLTGIGVLLGVLYWRTGLGSAILAHSSYNLLILLYSLL